MIETANYSVVDVKTAKVAEFDFEAVTMINSKGVQIWKEFMKALPPGPRYLYVRCPLKIINQINLFPSFKGGKVVEIASFYVPYFCETCDKPSSVLLTGANVMVNGKVIPPEMPCGVCKKPMEFDGNVQKYFLFLTRIA
jgi:hypothetical protein